MELFLGMPNYLCILLCVTPNISMCVGQELRLYCTCAKQCVEEDFMYCL